jgi:hypothetical protein
MAWPETIVKGGAVSTGDGTPKGPLQKLGKTVTAVFAVLGAIAAALAIWTFFFRGHHVPDFHGELNKLAAQQEFSDFVSDHADKVVHLSVWQSAKGPPPSYKAASGEKVRFLELYADCPLGVTVPSVQAGCTKVDYQVHIARTVDGRFYYDQGAIYLDGYFTVRPLHGAHQGVLAVDLVGVQAADALK